MPPDSVLGGGNQPWRLFWQNRSAGYLAIWNMNGTTLASGVAPTPNQVSDTDWLVVGTGDFNGDGQTDLVWQHQRSRLTTVWLMNGSRFIGAGLLNPNTVADKNWALRFVADMNADGQPDLVWQHETEGYVAVWLMHKLTFLEARLFTPGRVPDTDWRLVAAGDFNGDNRNDLVWQNRRTGISTVWLMNGTTFIAAGILSNNRVADTNWRLSTVTDVDRNGTPDFVWRHTSGLIAISFMEGLTFIGERLLNPDRVNAGWEIVGAR